MKQRKPRKALKRRSKSPAARYKLELDKFWSELVLARKTGCMFARNGGANCSDIFHPHHIFHREAYPQVRHELLNGVKICSKCHYSIHNRGEAAFHAHMAELLGDSWITLVELAAMPVPLMNEAEYYRRLTALNEAAIEAGVETR